MYDCNKWIMFNQFIIIVIMISIVPLIYNIDILDVFGEYSLVKKIPIVGTSGGPVYITYDQQNGLFFVSTYGSSGQIFVINSRTNDILSNFTLGQNTVNYVSDLAYNPITQKVYVLNSGFNFTGSFFHQISIIDPSTRNVVDVIPIGVNPAKIAVDPISGTMYVTALGANKVYIINSSHSIVNTISIPTPYGITYNFKNDLVYVNSYEYYSNNGHVYVIDPKISSIIKIIKVGNLPAEGISSHPAYGKVYVSNIRSSSVSVIDSATNTLVNDIPVGAYPSEIFYNSYDGNMYINNLNSPSISVLNSKTDTIKDSIKSLTIGDIAVDTSTGFIYLTNDNQRSIYVLKEIKQSSTCPIENQKHWDKIIFRITSPDIASTLNLPLNSELDIKIQDSPLNVSDLKEKIIAFLNLPSSEENRNAIDILNVDYDVVCSISEPIMKPIKGQNKLFSPTENLTKLLIK